MYFRVSIPEKFLSTLKKCGLAKAMLTVSHPRALVMFQQPLHQVLYRQNRWFDELLALLAIWTEDQEIPLPHTSPQPQPSSPQSDVCDLSFLPFQCSLMENVSLTFPGGH